MGLLLAGCAVPPDAPSRLEVEVRAAHEEYSPESRLRLWVGEVEGREILALDADRRVAGASTVKVLILVEAHAQVQAGKIRWEDGHVLEEEERAGGSGSLRREPAGSVWTCRQLARKMITESDNTASNILLRKVGMARVNARAEGAGMAVTRFHREFMDAEAMRKGLENWTTAREMGGLMRAIFRGEALAPEACAQMRETLELTSRGRIASGVPKEIPVGHKGGSLPGLRHDVGWVRLPGRPYVLSVFLDGVLERGEGEDRGIAAIEAIARAVYRSLGPSQE